MGIVREAGAPRKPIACFWCNNATLSVLFSSRLTFSFVFMVRDKRSEKRPLIDR